MRNGERLRRITVGICLAASIFFPPELSAGQTTLNAVGFKDLLQVKVHQLTVDPNNMQPVVFLADPEGERTLLIWIGPCEAHALNAEMEGTKPPRPLTHDLAGRIIEKLKGRIQRIIITHTKEGIYYATMVIDSQGSIVEIDARPSDSIIMAVKSKAPIFVSKRLFKEMSVPLKEGKGVEEPYGLTVQELTPSLAQSFAFKSTQGLLVADVRAGSRAEKDGLQRGDIIVEIGGETIQDVRSLRNALEKSKAAIKARIFRKGDFVSLSLSVK